MLSVAGASTSKRRDLRSDEFASRGSEILRYLVGWRFWEDSRRLSVARVVAVYSTSDVVVELPGRRFRILPAKGVRDAIDARGVDRDGNDLGRPVDWAAVTAAASGMTELEKPAARTRAGSQPPVEVEAPAEPELTPEQVAQIKEKLKVAGNSLWVFRERACVSHAELGRATGTSEDTIKTLEDGLRTPTIPMRDRILAELQLTTETIWSDELVREGAALELVGRPPIAARQSAVSFGRKCRERRLKRRVTRTEFASLAGITPMRLAEIERGEGEVVDGTMRRHIGQVLRSVEMGHPQGSSPFQIAS